VHARAARGPGLRIVAGVLKGRRLDSPTWPGLRPTSDRLRETLFNILGLSLTGARVLDAFAGTGAVGLEAWSRGAAHVTFVERDPRALALIARNVARCGVTERYAIIPMDLVDLVRSGPQAFRTVFDLIFLDPPYETNPAAALSAVAPTLAPGGLLVVEHAKRMEAPAEIGHLRRAREVTAGDSALGFYRPSEDATPDGPDQT
jgi:16S rRNA (guanine966-N2)-methyltransferase